MDQQEAEMLMLDKKEKERLQVDVENRIMEKYGGDPREMERIILDTLFDERHRLEKEKDDERSREDKKFYDQIHSRAIDADTQQMRLILKEMTRHFFDEVVGRFDPKVFKFATGVVPPSLTLLLNSMSPLRMVSFIKGGDNSGGYKTLDDQIIIQGEVEAYRKVAKKGTTILVSTHQSNMDSILQGYSLFRMGLPPVKYGAGLNLFSNKMISFFMHNLGSYKVDRRKNAELYKEILKTYAGLTIEFGHHNMFFPGGTRGRSGAVEKRLKKGLLGMGLDAYLNNLNAGKEKPDVFVIPCTINYHLVLEAETLIEDHLKDVGKSRYIIEDDEFSQPKVVFNFVRKLFTLDSPIYVTVSKPLDVFGNQIDDNCRSLDKKGRVIDRSGYVCSDGKVTFDPQRDKQYTEELGESIVEAFHRDTVIASTHLVSYVAFNWLLKNNPDMELYRLLRTGGKKDSIAISELYREIERTLNQLKEMELNDEIRLTATLRNKDIVMIVNEALAHLNSFHTTPAIIRKGDRFFHVDRNLLLYYRNRLASYGLEKGVKPL